MNVNGYLKWCAIALTVTACFWLWADIAAKRKAGEDMNRLMQQNAANQQAIQNNLQRSIKDGLAGR